MRNGMSDQPPGAPHMVTGGVIGQVNAPDGQIIAIGGNQTGKVYMQPVTEVITTVTGQRLERVFATVPAQGPSLVGRDALLADVKAQLFAGAPRCALQGLAGVGKSALGLVLAYDQQVLEHFTGGV